jgi:hypothetical protein
MKKAFLALERGEQQETWMEKCEGLSILRRLLVHNMEAISEDLKTICDAAVNEVGNLRSSVSRLAILFLGDLYAELPKAMEKHLAVSVAALQRKSGAEASAFIREDIDRALGVMVFSVHPLKSLSALLPTAESRISHVRVSAAKFLAEAVGRIGDRVLEVRDTEKLLRTTSSLLQDQHAETRQHGRKLLFLLASLEAFETHCTKVLSGNDLRAVETAVASLRKRGLEEPSSARSMASTRRGRSSSASSQPRSAGGKRISGDALKQISSQLAAKDWKEREQACSALMALVVANPTAFATTAINTVFDFIPLLTDSNSKVNLLALQTAGDFVPVLHATLEPVLAEMIPALMHSLSSKNGGIQAEAASVVSSLLQHIELPVLGAPLASAVLKGTPVSNEAILPLLVTLVQTHAGDPKACKALHKYIVKVAAKLHQDQRLRVHTVVLWRALHSALGEPMFSHSAVKGKIDSEIRSML